MLNLHYGFQGCLHLFHVFSLLNHYVEKRCCQEIESKLANCQVIDVTKLPNNGKVIFGATVVLVNTDTDEEVTYQIVGDDEADIKSGLISVNSPIARGLVGKELDDTVNITTPGGTVEFEIIEVNYI